MELHQVKKRYADQEVLQGVQLTIQPGEFVAIVGRSGCGKSTLLRLIAGLETASDGEVKIDGRILTGLHPDIRILFQDARLLPWKKVIMNVQLGVKGRSREEARKALVQVGLAERGEDWPSVLSGGQRQRVALARALAGQPRLLLLDEPLSALDALTRLEMQRLIEELWQKQNFTALLVTHDVSEAVMLADRVVMIDKGSIAAEVRIPLPRPREKNAGFVYYEKLILDRVMGEGKQQKARANQSQRVIRAWE